MTILRPFNFIQNQFSFLKFIKAVNKVVEQFEEKRKTHEEPEPPQSQSLFIKEDQVTYQINLDNILFVEAYGNYLKIHTTDKVHVVRDTMHEMLNKLPEELFIRVHKSFIISLSKIDSISGNRIFINKLEIPIGEIYKLGLKQKIESH